MPYIIETNHPRPRGTIQVVSRTAVATLADAYERVLDAAEPWAFHVDPLEESGGTIGPLPDGTVIEVRKVKWRDITNAVDLRDVLPTRENMLAAFNAA